MGFHRSLLSEPGVVEPRATGGLGREAVYVRPEAEYLGLVVQRDRVTLAEDAIFDGLHRLLALGGVELGGLRREQLIELLVGLVVLRHVLAVAAVGGAQHARLGGGGLAL